jgi:hypothetical protein
VDFGASNETPVRLLTMSAGKAGETLASLNPRGALTSLGCGTGKRLCPRSCVLKMEAGHGSSIQAPNGKERVKARLRQTLKIALHRPLAMAV